MSEQDLPHKVLLLERFRAKARCAHTQEKALELWWKLKWLLTEKQRGLLSTGWGHASPDIPNRSPSDLDYVCDLIRTEWGFPKPERRAK